jgi:hypothetical protein
MFIPTVQAADPFESTLCASGTLTMIPGSKEVAVMGFEFKGIARSNTDSEIYNNASEQCVGVLRQIRGEWAQNGYCKYLYPNGDFHFMEWTGDANGGNWKFLFGTGKWEGIKGGGTWKPLHRPRPVAPGTFQNCRIIEGTYELTK